jgi:hypothetical protein
MYEFDELHVPKGTVYDTNSDFLAICLLGNFCGQFLLQQNHFKMFAQNIQRTFSENYYLPSSIEVYVHMFLDKEPGYLSQCSDCRLDRLWPHPNLRLNFYGSWSTFPGSEVTEAIHFHVVPRPVRLGAIPSFHHTSSCVSLRIGQLYIASINKGSQDISVCIVTCYTVRGRGSISVRGRDFSLLYSVQNGFGTHPGPYQMRTGGSSRE